MSYIVNEYELLKLLQENMVIECNHVDGKSKLSLSFCRDGNSIEICSTLIDFQSNNYSEKNVPLEEQAKPKYILKEGEDFVFEKCSINSNRCIYYYNAARLNNGELLKRHLGPSDGDICYVYDILDKTLVPCRIIEHRQCGSMSFRYTWVLLDNNLNPVGYYHNEEVGFLEFKHPAYKEGDLVEFKQKGERYCNF